MTAVYSGSVARAKAQELRQDHRGHRDGCPLCNPRRDRVREDQLWEWARRRAGKTVPWRR